MVVSLISSIWFDCVPYIFMKFNFIDFFNSMQTCKKFKQFVEGDSNVINESASFMMENTTLARIKASLAKTSVEK